MNKPLTQEEIAHLKTLAESIDTHWEPEPDCTQLINGDLLVAEIREGDDGVTDDFKRQVSFIAAMNPDTVLRLIATIESQASELEKCHRPRQERREMVNEKLLKKAAHWERIVQTPCPSCNAPAGNLCTSLRRGELGQVMGRFHRTRTHNAKQPTRA